MALARNAAFNFAGAAAPAVLGLLTIPYVIAKLGVTDFGLLALVTAVVGYFGLLDVNVTAGSTKYVAQFNAENDRAQLHRTASFGLAFYAAIGVIGMVLLATVGDALLLRLFGLPAERALEVALLMRWAAAGFLLAQINLYLQSLPGALLRYDVSGSIEAAFGTALPLLTVAVLAFGGGLVEVVALRVLLSGVQSIVLLAALSRLMPGFAFAWPDAALRRALLSFSAFAFMSRVAALTYSHADKLVIGARVSVGALAYFVVPTTLVNRTMTLVSRLSGVMFPHASALAARQRYEDLKRHYLHASRYLFFVNGALALALAGFAEPLLARWVSPEFAREGATVLVLVALAQWVDSLTHLPTLVTDGLGHPRVTGCFALGRAALGLVLMVAAVGPFGIVGVAAAHLLSAVLMSLVFVAFVHGRTVPVALGDWAREALVAPLVALLPLPLLALWLAPWASTHWLHLVAAAVCAAAAAVLSGWALVIAPVHRHVLMQRLQLRGGQ